MAARRVAVLGSFVADLAFRTHKLPGWGETFLGSAFKLGPGGKGSNQAVAAARLGARVSFVSKLGRDAFGTLARDTYREEGIDARWCFESDDDTGAATIIVDERSGQNAIVVVPGACLQLTPREVDEARDVVASADVFVTQLELSLATVEHGLAMARGAGVPTILNPAPALPLPASVYPLCDYLTPNETEAAELTGNPVRDPDEAARAADVLLKQGARNVIVTLGAQGALVRNARLTAHVPAVDAGPVIETTGAGDAFNGGFAVALAEGRDIVEAARFGCTVAGIAVTRHGTAPAMPRRAEVDALFAAQRAADAKGRGTR